MANQLKTLMPVGVVVVMVADVKYAQASAPILTVNMWWTHTIKPRILMDTISHTMPMYLNGSSLPV